jgi:hypothetical protein
MDAIGGKGYGYGAPEILTGGRDGNFSLNLFIYL